MGKWEREGPQISTRRWNRQYHQWPLTQSNGITQLNSDQTARTFHQNAFKFHDAKRAVSLFCPELSLHRRTSLSSDRRHHHFLAQWKLEHLLPCLIQSSAYSSIRYRQITLLCSSTSSCIPFPHIPRWSPTPLHILRHELGTPTIVL